MSRASWRFWNHSPLDPEIRLRFAETTVRWVFLPSVCLTMVAIATMVMTVGLSDPRRYIPIVAFAVPCYVACKLRGKKRWIPAAAALCTAAMLHVLASVLVSGDHAPLYGIGVLVVTLTGTLFGWRWGALASAALVGTAAAWLALNPHGLAWRSSATASLMYGVYVAIFLLALGLVARPQRLLNEALCEARRKHEEAEQARAATAASELAFHAVFDQASVALALLTADGRVTRLNPRGAEFLTDADAPLLGQSLSALARWSDAQRELLQRAVERAARGEASRHELSCRRASGAAQTCQIVLSPFCVPNGTIEHVLVEIVDVSDLVETRSMLAQARRLEALGQLSGGVAHDLNNMLTAIMSGCDLVRFARGDERKISDYVSLIQASVERAAALTKQLLAFGRKDRWNSEQLDASQLLREVARLLERTLHKNIDLVVSADAACYVRGDAAALEHALLNLALNAQAALPDGGTLTLSCRRVLLDEVEGRMLEGDAAPGPTVVLSVEDTGTGMSAEDREHMFEPFFTTKPAGEGTGLGLAAVHGTVRGHRGAIGVWTELGIGTRVALYFPATSATTQPVLAPIESEAPARLHARVLLADDETLARAGVAALLESAGCRVDTVEDGTALIEALTSGATPDVIVSDLAMPGLGGVKLVQTIEALRPEGALLLITGFSGDDVSSACPPRSQRRLLRKPFSRAELLRTLGELLATVDAEADAAQARGGTLRAAQPRR
jgi:PAS domain S-box-containing protein